MTDRQRSTSRFLRWAAALALLLLPVLGGSAPAHAADGAPLATGSSAYVAVKGYVYWGYYTWNDKKETWDYATVGANDRSAIPEDGDVYGLRWALVVKDPRLPRADGDFDEICGDEPAASGQKRLAFVIDYGTESDAVGDDSTPQAEGVCTTVDESFTAQQALQVELPVRTGDGGLICGIGNYPSQGCGSTVANADEPPGDEPVELNLPSDPAHEPSSTSSSDTSDSSDDDSSNKLLTVGLPIVVVVLLGTGALVLRRRQS